MVVYCLVLGVPRDIPATFSAFGGGLNEKDHFVVRYMCPCRIGASIDYFQPLVRDAIAWRRRLLVQHRRGHLGIREPFGRGGYGQSLVQRLPPRWHAGRFSAK